MKRLITLIILLSFMIAQFTMAAENYVILPNDAANTGKKTRTYDQTINAQAVHTSVGLIGDPAGTNLANVTVGGAIKVDGSAVTQPISGTVGVSGTVPVSITSMPSTPVSGTFWQSTQPVSLASVPSHPVTGTFWQATQPISGTVTANINSADGTASGSVTNGQNVSLALAGYYSASVVISGAYTVATFTPQVSSDGTIWVNTQFFDPNAQTTAASVSANGTWVIANVGGMSSVRVLCTAMATGSATINLRATTAQANSLIPLGAKTIANSMAVNLATDQALPAGSNAIGSVKLLDAGGTNAGTIKAASTPAASTDPAVVVSMAGANSATKIGDGTNNAAIKAASTAAATTDPSVVVNISPNSPAHPVSQSGANWSINAAQINGVVPLMGNGVTGTGSPRVTLASDTSSNTNPLYTSSVGTSAAAACTNINVNATGALVAVKASAGNLFGFSLLNNTAAVVWISFWNVATGSVTLGTTAPTCVFPIPANGTLVISPGDAALMNSATAISFAAVTTYNGSTTASVSGSIFYK